MSERVVRHMRCLLESCPPYEVSVLCPPYEVSVREVSAI